MSKKILLLLSLCLALNANIFAKVYAEEIVVSGNGAGSNNEVQVSSVQNTTVTQENTAEINNEVESQSNSGENTASNNQGDAIIHTGDATSQTNVLNEGVNTNIAVNNPCCNESETAIKIENNGSGSTNTISSQNTQSISSNQINNALINNNITVNANTGYNTASYNNGNVVIKTGNINSSIKVTNENINTSIQHLSVTDKDVKISIHSNAANSVNNIFYSNPKSLTSQSTNNSYITNTILSLLNTGHNNANGNSGDIYIGTGGILSLIEITNSANNNFLHADCECEKPENPKPTPTITPPPSPTPCTNNCDNHPSNGSVGGVSATSSNGGGEVLPATGSYLLYLLTLASFITFISGWYLRYRTGITPGM